MTNVLQHLGRRMPIVVSACLMLTLLGRGPAIAGEETDHAAMSIAATTSKDGDGDKDKDKNKNCPTKPCPKG